MKRYRVIKPEDDFVTKAMAHEHAGRIGEFVSECQASITLRFEDGFLGRFPLSDLEEVRSGMLVIGSGIDLWGPADSVINSSSRKKSIHWGDDSMPTFRTALIALADATLRKDGDGHYYSHLPVLDEVADMVNGALGGEG